MSKKKCKNNSESLHLSLSKLIHKIKKDKSRYTSNKNRTKSQPGTFPKEHVSDTGMIPEQFPTQAYIPMSQDYAISHYQVQTLGQQHQLNRAYRSQMASLTTAHDSNLSYNDPYINPANFLQNPTNFVHDPYVQNLVMNSSRVQPKTKDFTTITKHQGYSITERARNAKDHEDRVNLLLKIQKRKLIDHPLDLREMQMLEKSTRTMWIGKLSEFVQEPQIEIDASQYGQVMSVNIVREGERGFTKCFGFVEFCDRQCIERFMKTSNHCLGGDKISCRPGKVPSLIQPNAIASGYVNKETLAFTPMFELMLENTDKTILEKRKDREEIHRPKTMGEYFPLLPI